MDRKSWLWRKKSSEKIISAAEQVDTSPLQRAREEQDGKGNVPANSDESRNLLVLSDTVKDLNEMLAAALAESKTKDVLIEESMKELEDHKKAVEEALSGWEKAEAKAGSLKEELDTALRQKSASEVRVSHLDGALKECMRQLRHVREEQEQKIHDTLMKKARELDIIRTELEGKLAEANQRLLEADAENRALRKSFQERLRVIEEMREGKAQAEAEVNLLQMKLGSLEQDNAAVKYELRVLEKELEIRNEEREDNKKAADAANRQHSESMKKIAKLESECQRLRVLVRKKLPGPAAVAQMKMEVETLSKDTAEWKRRKSHARKGGFPGGSLPGDPGQDSAQENSIKEIKFLQERLLSMEEETEILKETLVKKNGELHMSRVTCARTANKLSKVESELDALCRDHRISRINGTASDGHVELSKYVIMTSEPSLASISEDGGNEDEASCAESWATALISELAQFKKEKPNVLSNKVIESPEFDLMDDFIEQERLATVSSEKPEGSPTFSGKSVQSGLHTELKTEQNSNLLAMMDKKTPSEETHVKMETKVLVADKHTTQEQDSSSFQSRIWTNELALSRTQELLHMILDAHAKGQNMNEILENVKAITTSQHAGSDEISKIKEKLTCLKVLSTDGLKDGSVDGIISDQVSPRSPSEGNSSEDEAGQFSHSKHNRKASNNSKLNASIHKILELIEGFVQSNSVNHAHSERMPLDSSDSLLIQNSTSVPGYTMRVLQWQNSELDSLIQSLVTVCNDLLQGKAEIAEFVEKVSSALDWIVNHFFSLQDVSSMRAIIKKQLEWDDELHSDSESEAQFTHSPTFGQRKAKKIEKGKDENEKLTSKPGIGASEANSISVAMNKLEEVQKQLSQKEMLEHQLNEEISKLKEKFTILQSEKQDLHGMFQQANNNLEAVKSQLLESEQRIEELQRELATCKVSKQSLEDDIEKHISMNEELDFQLKSARAELHQYQEKFTSLQAELEEKGSCFQELEATCLDLQLQLESGGKQESSKDDKTSASHGSTHVQEMQLKKEKEILAATTKLGELHQAVMVLDKKLKSLASQSEAKDTSLQPSSASLLPEKSTPSTNEHASLFDHMQAENMTEESQDCLEESSKGKDVIVPKREKDENVQQELNTPRGGKTGLFYGWQMPSESSSISSHKHEKQKSAGNIHDDMDKASPISPAKFFSAKMKNPEAESPKSSSVEGIVPVSPKKRSHGGGIARFLKLKKRGH